MVAAIARISPTPLPPLRLLRPANPVVRAVLRSPAHALLSDRLAILSYVGHRSGVEFQIPVRYAETRDRAFVAIAVRPGRKLWWRSFADSRKAALLVRRRSLPVVGRLAVGESRERAAAAYLARYPRSASPVRDAAIVVFERTG
jgi:hypothetical protein